MERFQAQPVSPFDGANRIRFKGSLELSASALLIERSRLSSRLSAQRLPRRNFAFKVDAHDCRTVDHGLQTRRVRELSEGYSKSAVVAASNSTYLRARPNTAEMDGMMPRVFEDSVGRN